MRDGQSRSKECRTWREMSAQTPAAATPSLGAAPLRSQGADWGLMVARVGRVLVMPLLTMIRFLRGGGSSVHFYSLSPIDRVERCVYDDILSWALKERTVINIAVSGRYGSGKSSFLRSYFKRDKSHHRVLWISLLSFASHDFDLSRAIVQQILLSAKRKALPYSMVDRILPLSFKRYALSCAYVLTTASLCSFLFARHFLFKLPGVSVTYCEHRTAVLYGILCVIVVWLCWTLKIIHRTFSRCRFTARIRSSLAELEVDRAKGVSAVDAMLDELVYFFSVNKFDCIVFEDIDRFNDSGIFVKLKELNAVLNNSEFVGRPIKFVYSVRDDVFETATERAKCFDCTIPIIPVENGFNARAILAKRLAAAFPCSFTRKFKIAVNELGGFIPDMRSLNCVLNEYLIVRDRLCGNDVDGVRLFALTVMKVLLPSLYARLGTNRCIVASLLDRKKIVVASLVSSIESQIQEREKALVEWRSKIDPDITHQWLSAKDMQAFRAELGERQSEVSQLRRKLASENSLSLIAMAHRGLITIDDVRNAVKVCECDESAADLVYQLVESGHLCEDYLSTVSYFYDGYLTRHDHEFENRVRSFGRTKYDEPIDDPGSVVDDLPSRYFMHHSILNYSLLRHMLENDKDYREKITLVVGLLQRMGDAGLPFISGYLLAETKRFVRSKLMLHLSRNWPGYLDALLSAASLTETEKVRQLGALLQVHAQVPAEVKLMPSVWQFLDRIKDPSPLMMEGACSYSMLKRAVLRDHFEFKICSDAVLRRARLIEEVRSARRHMDMKRRSR